MWCNGNTFPSTSVTSRYANWQDVNSYKVGPPPWGWLTEVLDWWETPNYASWIWRGSGEQSGSKIMNCWETIAHHSLPLVLSHSALIYLFGSREEEAPVSALGSNHLGWCCWTSTDHENVRLKLERLKFCVDFQILPFMLLVKPSSYLNQRKMCCSYSCHLWIIDTN